MTTYRTFNALLKIAEDEESPHSDLIDVERKRSKEYDDKKRAERKAKLKRKSELAAKSTQAAREAVAANEPSKVLGDAWDIFYDDAKNKVGRVYNKGKQVVNGTINLLNSGADAAQREKELLDYAPWLAGGLLGGTGIGALIGSRYKNTLLGAILGGVGGAGIATGGKYLYNRFAKHASADVDYDAIERRAKFRMLLTR